MKNPFIVALLLCIIGFISIGQNFILIQAVCALLLFVINLPYFKEVFVRYKNINLVLLCFCLVVCFASYWGYEHSPSGVQVFNPIRGCLYAFVIFQYYITVEALVLQNSLHKIVRHWVWLLFIILLVQDIDLLFIHPRKEESFDLYLIGDKFTITYLHMFFIALVTKRFDKYGFSALLILFLITYVIAQQSFCSTGKVLVLLLIILIFAKPYMSKILPTKFTILLAIGLSILFAFFSVSIFELDFVDYIVSEKLGESSTVTGRVKIYGVILEIVMGSPWIGYGYGNSSFLVADIIGFGNAQNGFLDNVVNYGIIGTTLIILLLILCIQSIGKRSLSSRTYMLLCVIYLLIIAATIEITINTLFICIIPLLLDNNNYKYEPSQNIHNCSHLRS